MRTLVPAFIVAAVTLGAFALVAQEPRGGGGKGAPHKNLQVLPDDANLIPTMRSFVTALGAADKGGCNFCHEQDRSSDAKMTKVMARNMIKMAKQINSNFPDGKVHVTCYTCHRGSEMPLTEPAQ